jgi:hypothetical protein
MPASIRSGCKIRVDLQTVSTIRVGLIVGEFLQLITPWASVLVSGSVSGVPVQIEPIAKPRSTSGSVVPENVGRVSDVEVSGDLIRTHH